jgi:hypothetical protein
MVAQALVDIFTTLSVIEHLVPREASTFETARLIMTHLGATMEVSTCIVMLAFIYLQTPHFLRIGGIHHKAWVTAAFVASH